MKPQAVELDRVFVQQSTGKIFVRRGSKTLGEATPEELAFIKAAKAPAKKAAKAPAKKAA